MWSSWVPSSELLCGLACRRWWCTSTSGARMKICMPSRSSITSLALLSPRPSGMLLAWGDPATGASCRTWRRSAQRPILSSREYEYSRGIQDIYCIRSLAVSICSKTWRGHSGVSRVLGKHSETIPGHVLTAKTYKHLKGCARLQRTSTSLNVTVSWLVNQPPLTYPPSGIRPY